MATVTVSTWEDFVSAVAVRGDTVNVSPGTVWDMNEILPGGIITQLTIAAKEINGNGLIIQKMAIRNSGFIAISEQSTINDIIFKDMVVEGSEAFVMNTISTSWNRCVFSGLFQDATFMKSTNSGVYTMSRCAFNLNFQGNSLLYLGDYGSGVGGRALQMIDCNVTMSGKSSNASAISRYDSRFKYNLVSFVNCFVSGENPFKYLYICWDSTYSSSRTYSRYSVFDIFLFDGQSLTNAPNRTLITSCIVNITKAHEGCTINSEILEVTDEQLHDAEYLASIGFPIGR